VVCRRPDSSRQQVDRATSKQANRPTGQQANRPTGQKVRRSEGQKVNRSTARPRSGDGTSMTCQRRYQTLPLCCRLEVELYKRTGLTACPGKSIFCASWFYVGDRRPETPSRYPQAGLTCGVTLPPQIDPSRRGRTVALAQCELGRHEAVAWNNRSSVQSHGRMKSAKRRSLLPCRIPQIRVCGARAIRRL
jgi:hypothetical protein